MGILALRSIEALPVFFLLSLMEKRHFWQLKMASFCSTSFAKALAFRQQELARRWSGPQQNRLVLVEWPWKSKQYTSLLPYSFLRLLASRSRQYASGKTCLLSLWNWRLRSLPLQLVLKLPATTPSGFIIGMTLKMYLLRRGLHSGFCSSPSTKPSTTNEDTDSPGWILPQTSTTCFLSWLCSSVIVSRGSGRPPSDSHSVAVDTSSPNLAAMRLTQPSSLLQVQGIPQAMETVWPGCSKSTSNSSWQSLAGQPKRQCFSVQVTSPSDCLQGAPSLLVKGPMPLRYRFGFLIRLQMLSLTRPAPRRLVTVKQNQLQCPLVLVSLLTKQSYSPGPASTTKSRFPPSKSESKRWSASLTLGLSLTSPLPTPSTASLSSRRLSWYLLLSFQVYWYCWFTLTLLIGLLPRQTKGWLWFCLSVARMYSDRKLVQLSGIGPKGSLGFQPRSMSGSMGQASESRLLDVRAIVLGLTLSGEDSTEISRSFCHPSEEDEDMPQLQGLEYYNHFKRLRELLATPSQTQLIRRINTLPEVTDSNQYI